MADAGVAARRVCEQMIEEGRVEVNGEVITRLPVFVDPREDQIEVDGRPLERPAGSGSGRKLYIILNKPERTLTTASDEPGLERRTVLDLVDHPSKPRLFAVGRLGWDETGLVLLTNDGELANRLSHPRYGVAKTYLAIVKGDVNEADLHRLGKQMFKLQRLEARHAGRNHGAKVEMSIFKREPGKTTLRVTMKEGKNRYVADVLQAAGFPVRKVAAVSIGPLQLRGLSVGSWRELDRDEIRMLRDACKEQSKAQAAESGSSPAAHGSTPAAFASEGDLPSRPRAPRPNRSRGTSGTARGFGGTNPGARRAGMVQGGPGGTGPARVPRGPSSVASSRPVRSGRSDRSGDAGRPTRGVQAGRPSGPREGFRNNRRTDGATARPTSRPSRTGSERPTGGARPVNRVRPPMKSKGSGPRPNRGSGRGPAGGAGRARGRGHEGDG